jgi:hypothetical protein
LKAAAQKQAGHAIAANKNWLEIPAGVKDPLLHSFSCLSRNFFKDISE